MSDIKDILALMQSPSPEDNTLVEKAYTFVAHAHKDHTRFSGEPYLIHLVATAKGLAGLGMGAKTVAAGLLHDSIEDVGVSPETIEKEFGKEIRFLVEGVTKLGRFKYRGAQRHVESLRKLLVATGKDARVLIIKLMDRLHNMRTLEHVPAEKRTRIAQETLEIYAAIAHRLGMSVVRQELEDLAFQYVYPEEWKRTKSILAEHTKIGAERLEKMSRLLKKKLAENNITNFESDVRVKGLYSFWQKLLRKGGDISQVYDIEAMRVVVNDIADCYRVLGLVHQLWQPLPNKIKDYIAFPKPNGYQGLHTTVFTGDGGILEVQIRTRQMHEEAQFGIASHVSYKEPGENDGGNKKLRVPGGERQSSFDWVRSLVPRLRRMRPGVSEPVSDKKEASNRNRYGAPATPVWLDGLDSEVGDPEFETILKTDIFSHRVFVFTPSGDVVDLPLNSSPIDFAYAIHSDIGDHIFGAKVNGKMVSLDTILNNGDIVQIDTRKSASPKKKWLDFAKTTLARRHIRTAVEQQEKDKGIK